MNTPLSFPIKIAIVDDHPLVRQALSKLFCEHGKYQVHILAGSGEEFIKAVTNNNPPDIVLLDLKMSGIDGFETLSFIRKKLKNTKVIILSLYDDASTLLRILKLGANAYLSKDAEPEEIILAVEQTIAQGEYFPFSKRDMLRNMDKSDIYRKISSISPREFDFLKYTCTGMPYKDVAAKMHVSRYTLDGYRTSLYKKLDVSSRAELIFFALRHKLVKVEDVDQQSDDFYDK
ncbi:MAG: response regulator transcription factor [Chitinophagaceae bacterium]|nr:response regulator transcription factor [Chitinophagaceae bacterium]